MLNSRDINNLRPDVAANCRVFLGACGDAGLRVLVTATVRDGEYQRKCYENGTAATPLPSFHGVKAGLAFDICKNVKGQEYSDAEFFRRCGEIGERLGFEWGGRWKSFPDRPHFQWSQGGKYSSAMVRAGKLPPAMPRFEEECEMTRDEIQALVKDEVDKALEERDALAAKAAEKVSSWHKGDWEAMTAAGVFDGTRPGGGQTREQTATVCVRLLKLAGGV